MTRKVWRLFGKCTLYVLCALGLLLIIPMPLVALAVGIVLSLWIFTK